jgi:hypothetical protein
MREIGSPILAKNKVLVRIGFNQVHNAGHIQIKEGVSVNPENVVISFYMFQYEGYFLIGRMAIGIGLFMTNNECYAVLVTVGLINGCSNISVILDGIIIECTDCDFHRTTERVPTGV